VLCVTNITGRARVLACRTCRALVRCESCDAAVGLDDASQLVCRRCGAERPAVCQVCGAGAFANLRPGVARLREELAAAAARPVAALTGAGAAAEGPDPDDAGVVVGTEALLHRMPTADVVAFLEFDSEMLAPRFRAAEQALALIVRAGRIAPEVLLQTFVPDHPVVRAARRGDPTIVVDAERARRRQLHLPPYGALALLAGPDAGDLAAQLSGAAGEDRPRVEVGATGDGRHLVRADDWSTLGAALAAADRPPGSRIRVEVDPPRI